MKTAKQTIKQLLVLVCSLAMTITPILAQEEVPTVQGEIGKNVDTQADLKCSLVELLAIVELNLLGKVVPTKPMKERLEECERVSGLTTEITASLPLPRRVADLMQEAPPDTQLMDYVVKSSRNNPKFLREKSELREWYSSLFQMVTALEIATYSKADPAKSLLARLERLEKDVLAMDDPPSGQDMGDRVAVLYQTIGPTTDHADRAIAATAKRWDWIKPGSQDQFASNAALPQNAQPRHPNRITKSLKNSMDGTKSVLTSPTFWKVVGVTAAAGALAVGGYFLLKNQSGGGSSYGNSEHRCTGMTNCTVCSTCSYCQHCRTPTFVPPCGVYFRVRALVPRYP